MIVSHVHVCQTSNKKDTTNSVDPDQTPQNVASDQDLYYLH